MMTTPSGLLAEKSKQRVADASSDGDPPSITRATN
jgi:hypothetical protein